MTNRMNPHSEYSPGTVATATATASISHEPAAEATIAAFAAWLDMQLAELETRFQRNWPHHSVKQTFGRK